MSDNRSGEATPGGDPNDGGWPPADPPAAPWDTASWATSPSPNPFSREGSSPKDALGADSATPPIDPTPPADPPPPSNAPSQPLPPPTQAWPSYPAGGPPQEDRGGPHWPQPPGQSDNPYGYSPDAIPPYGYPNAATAPIPHAPITHAPIPSAPYTPPYTPYPAAPGPYEPVPDPYASAPEPYAQPPAPAYGVTPYQGGYGAYNPYGASPYGVVPRNHPQAVLSLVLGIVGMSVCVSVFPLVGIAGFVLGRKARREIDAEPGRYAGRGLATAGWVLGIISIVWSVLWVLIVVLGFSGQLDS
jgi:Domain of unknown function (DUF4190)